MTAGQVGTSGEAGHRLDTLELLTLKSHRIKESSFLFFFPPKGFFFLINKKYIYSHNEK